jgi:hypothetical protein
VREPFDFRRDVAPIRGVLFFFSHEEARMRYRSALILTLMLLAAACKPTAPAAEPAAAAPSAGAEPVASPAPAVAPAVETAFTKEMPYADLRKRLTDAGWLPLRDPMCRENVGGAALVCGELPEVESCSGDGHCVMHFANASEGKRIRVTAYGPSERWNVAGEEAAFAVNSWDVSALDPASRSSDDAAPACPSPDFDAFLKAFASDDRIERAFTAPAVRVAELGGGEDGDDTVFVYLPAAGYADFNVKYADKAFHFIDANGAKDASSLDLKVEAQGDDVRIVRYQYGMSEGNSYKFERKAGCWQLTEDPDPPSP